MPETNIDRPLVIDRIASWRDCDPTGAVYPPRFLDFVAEAVEAWFRDVLAHDWYGLQRDLGLGSPIVHTSLDVEQFLTIGDRLALHVFIEDVGRSSYLFGSSATWTMAAWRCGRRWSFRSSILPATGQRRYRTIFERESEPIKRRARMQM